VVGEHLGFDLLDAEVAGHGSGGEMVVAGEHDHLDALGAQRVQGGWGGSLTGSAMAMIPATWSSTPTKITVAPSARSRSARGIRRLGSKPSPAKNAALPT
jgi:hypothetical protein